MKQTAPSFEKLVDWQEGRLTPEEAQIMAEQMAEADAAAQSDLAWLQKFYRVSQNQIAADPPPTVSERLARHFAAYADTRHQPSFVQRLIASLSFDSRLTLARGVRAAATTDNQRQFVYETDLATIALTLQQRSHDKNFDLLGQLIPIQDLDAEMIRVVLEHEQTEFDSTLTDDLGEFSLIALPTGSYTLVLTGDLYEIKITPLNLTL